MKKFYIQWTRMAAGGRLFKGKVYEVEESWVAKYRARPEYVRSKVADDHETLILDLALFVDIPSKAAIG